MKSVLITGATSGIGRSFAYGFIKRSYNLVLVARHYDQLKKLKDELHSSYKDPQIHIFAYDLTMDNACENLYQDCRNAGLDIDILVNNAGFGDHGAFLDRPLDKQEKMIELNVLALTRLTYLFGGEMLARNSGAILNVASIAAFSPGPYMSIYYATKSYVYSFSRALAQELRHTAISVTCLCPGPVNTDFFRKADLLASPLWRFFPPAEPATVAEKGIRALLKKRAVVINSLSGKAFQLACKLIPEKWMIKMVGMTNGRR